MLTTLSEDLSHERVRADVVISQKMPGLDLLRGVAILAVIFFHGFAYSAPSFPWHNRAAEMLFSLTSLGWTGVNLFFTLSGFLITGNLIDSARNPNFYSRFYIRRALRILPPYLLILFLLAITRTVSLNYVAVCLLLLANWPKLLLIGPFKLYPVLWSLSVEQQFYAIWPWLYRRMRLKGLFAICIVMILLCPIFRGIAVTLSGADVFSKTFMIGDNLAIGAAIAIVCRSHRLSLRGLLWIGLATLCIPGITLQVLNKAGHAIRGDAWGASVGYSMLEWFTAGILIMALYTFRERPIHRSLHFLLFFGEISYGLYLIHMLCQIVYDRFAGDQYLTQVHALLSRFVIVNGVAGILAILSRRYIENPIIRLGSKIPAAN
jgi:peptidoglycan/LPS O-acetylase OafA/YrhL